MRLRDVRDIQLQSILNEQRGMSFSHVTKLRMVMQELFHQAYRSRLIPFDPSDGLRLPKNVKGSHRSITEEERAHILEVAQYHPSGLWVLLILYSGLRPGEAAALQWKDIDFDKNEIHVYKAVESGTNTIKTPKTTAGIRDIPMRKELRRELEREYILQRQREGIAIAKEQGKYTGRKPVEHPNFSRVVEQMKSTTSTSVRWLAKCAFGMYGIFNCNPF